VLSCANLIAATSSVVATVFSGGPGRPGQISGWDRSCGFSAGDDVMAVRSAEDVVALSRLGAQPRPLGFSQYRAVVPLWVPDALWRITRYVRARRGRGALAQEMADRLASELVSAGANSCAIPLGVAHVDHLLTASACLEVAQSLPDLNWVVYEDLPYVLEDPHGRETALAAVRDAGFELEPLDIDDDADADPETGRKRTAVSAYASQLRGLGERAETAIAAPERYHLLRRTMATTAQATTAQ
jgi:LmbE family N-acetylglucosaminyl deacetylase